jgi:hypothetical protein
VSEILAMTLASMPRLRISPHSAHELALSSSRFDCSRIFLHLFSMMTKMRKRIYYKSTLYADEFVSSAEMTAEFV